MQLLFFLFGLDSHSFRHFSVHLSMFYVIVMSLTKATSYSDIFSIEPMLRFFCLPCIHKYNIWSIPTKKHGENAKRYSKQQTQSTWRIWTLVVAFVKGITVVLSIREHLHSWRIPACTTKFSLTAGSTLGSRYTPPRARLLGKCRTPTVASVQPSCQDRGKELYNILGDCGRSSHLRSCFQNLRRRNFPSQTQLPLLLRTWWLCC